MIDRDSQYSLRTVSLLHFLTLYIAILLDVEFVLRDRISEFEDLIGSTIYILLITYSLMYPALLGIFLSVFMYLPFPYSTPSPPPIFFPTTLLLR